MLKPSVADLLPKLSITWKSRRSTWRFRSYLISSAARETLTVMLSGMGGDEVFAGYPRQMAMKIASAFDPVPNMLRRPLMKTVAGALPGGRRTTDCAASNAKKFARSAALDFRRSLSRLRHYFTNEMKRRLYSDEWRATTAISILTRHRLLRARARSLLRSISFSTSI
jgi:asparagine synthase (glutamine-hydrolysing)